MKNIKLLNLVSSLIVSFLLFSVTTGFAANFSVQTSAKIDASPVFSPNGNAIYITSGDAPANGKIYSIESNSGSQPGYVNWVTNIQADEIYCSVAVGGAGTVYLTSGDADASLLAIHPSDGSTAWPYTVGGPSDTVPAVASDGTIYVTVDDTDQDGTDGLFAINPDGSLKWVYYVDAEDYGAEEPQSSPTIGPDGTIYFRTGSDSNSSFPASDGFLYVINPNGTFKWRIIIPATDEIDVPPVVAPNGRIYVTGGDGYLYAINSSDATRAWSFYVGQSYSVPSLDPNGNTLLYLGNQSGQLFAINYNNPTESSQPIYNIPDNGAIASTPAVAANGTIYVTSMDDNLYALQILSNGQAAKKWHFHTGGPIDSSPKIGSDGTVYFGSQDGYFYAVDPNTMLNAPGVVAIACNAQIHLSWTAETGATSYKVKRSTSSGTETTIITITSTSYTDNNVVNGTTYYYEVSAVYSTGESENSDENIVTPASAPAAPTSLVIAAGNQTAYLLSWSPVVNAVSYKIKRSTTSGSETTITTTTTTHYTDSPLQNGTTYYYVVSAVDSCGDESANSAEASVTPAYASAPVFTSGVVSGDNIYENCDNGYGGANSFTFTVSGPPNSTWTIYSLPEGNPYNQPNVSYNTIIATITLDVNGNGSYNDPNAGTFDWSSQFYQLVSGDVASQVFGYTVTDVPPPDGSFGSPVTNPLIPLVPETMGSVMDFQYQYHFWGSGSGEGLDQSQIFFDDSTEFGDNWDGDFWWDGAEWLGYTTLFNSSGQWDPSGPYSVDLFPFGYGDTYWFSDIPYQYDYMIYADYVYYESEHPLVSFIGIAP